MVKSPVRSKRQWAAASSVWENEQRQVDGRNNWALISLNLRASRWKQKATNRILETAG
ncbi:hypothetical protein KCP75_23670 [Salmonella enterica subsp. enterica]|nr:hypothetical protein KCP75_23670 [Salmonella enterica subsp. enterica]